MEINIIIILSDYFFEQTCPMFKTVRAQHGAGDSVAELEYTILPQSDDRSPSASSGEDEPSCAAGNHQQSQYHQQQHHHHHYRRSFGDCDSGNGGARRTILIIIVMLVLGCGVVAAAVLVPILLAARLVSVPASARLQTFAVAASGVIHSARGDYVQLLPVKHAVPGTVIQFEPVPERPPPATNRRKRRSAAAARGKSAWRAVGHVQRRYRTRSAAASFRSLDFRIRQ